MRHKFNFHKQITFLICLTVCQFLETFCSCNCCACFMNCSGGGNAASYSDQKPDYEFNVWTKPDCAGTSYENRNRCDVAVTCRLGLSNWRIIECVKELITIKKINAVKKINVLTKKTTKVITASFMKLKDTGLTEICQYARMQGQMPSS